MRQGMYVIRIALLDVGVIRYGVSEVVESIITPIIRNCLQDCRDMQN